MEPQLTRFKQFARNHPKLVEEVRGNRKTWQEIYEEWMIFGEDHDIWDPYRSENIKTASARKGNDHSPVKESEGQKESPFAVLSLLKNIDFDDLLDYASQINEALKSVQKLVEQYQKDKRSNGEDAPEFRQPPPPPGYGPYPHQNQSPYWH